MAFGETTKVCPSLADAAGSSVNSEVLTVSSVTSLRVVVAPESLRLQARTLLQLALSSYER